MNGAASFLRPDQSRKVSIVEGKSDGQNLKVLIKGYLESTAGPEQYLSGDVARSSIATDLFKVLRGTSNLVFPECPQRGRILRGFPPQLLREEMGLPERVLAQHHGNLSKEVREDAEEALKKTDQPATAICTSTLELGIDIGPVKSVVQVGPHLRLPVCARDWVDRAAARADR